MSSAVITLAHDIAKPLLNVGYRVITERVYAQHFGSGWLLLARDETVARVLNDRGQWFVELGSSAEPERYFDARLVLQELGVAESDGDSNEAAARAVCEQLARCVQRVDAMFSASAVPATRRALRAKEVESARQRFGPAAGRQ